MKGLPSGYNKDLQEDKEAVFDAEDTVVAAIPAVTAVMTTLTVARSRAERAASGMLLATEVADYLVARGLPFRDAHALVGGLVRRLLREGRDFEALSVAEWREINELFGEDVRERITARAAVNAKRTPQSTNPRGRRPRRDRGAWLDRVDACSAGAQWLVSRESPAIETVATVGDPLLDFHEPAQDFASAESSTIARFLYSSSWLGIYGAAPAAAR